MTSLRQLCLALVAATGSAFAQNLPLTEGTNIAAAVSPDGKIVAFDLHGTIWTMPVAGGAATALTDPLADARQPAFSPDGRTIAYQSFKDGGWHIWSSPVSGVAPTQITSGGFDEREPAFSPDGQWLAVSSDRGGNYDIWIISIDGAEARQLTVNAANEHSPSWSPDGKRIAFVSDRPNGNGIYAVSFAGVGERLLAPVDGAAAGVSWSPDGANILYVATTSTRSALHALDVSTGVSRQVSDNSEDVFGFRAAWMSPTEYLYTADAAIKQTRLGADSPIGRRIPFSAKVILERPAYTRKTFDFTSRTPRPVQGLRGPVFAPDGRRVAFAALGDIWLGEAGQPARKLTDDVALDFDPAWSPDGSRIAFVSDRSGKTEVWTVDVASSETRQLTSIETEVQYPSWSPDGKRIAFFKVLGLAGLGSGSLNLLDVASGAVTQLRPSIWAPSRASWSPDNRRLVVSALSPSSSRFREGYSQFQVIALDGGDAMSTPHPDRSLALRGVDGPVWSPDGTWFAYVFDGRLWRVPVSPEGAVAGAPIRMTDELADAPSWSADSRSVLYLNVDRLKRVDLDGNVTDAHPQLDTVPAIPAQRIVVHAGRLFDGIDTQTRRDIDIVIDDNVITAVEPHHSRDNETRVIDASNRTVIPGLIESHTHMTSVFGERLGRIWLAMGVTSTREPGADPYDAIERREAWASGRRLGPRAFLTGGLTDGSRVFYGFANSVTTPEHLELELDRAKRLNYDLIKTYVRMPDHLQKTIVARAHEIGIPVSSHEIFPAVSYGVDAVEHLRGTSRRGYSPKQTEMGFSYADVSDLLAKSGMTITPTMGLSGGFNLKAMRNADILTNPVFVALFRDAERTALTSAVERARANETSLSKTVDAMGLAITDIVKKGGRITAGTDSPFIPYGLSFLVELMLYEDAGLSPADVIRSATIWPATALGIDKHLGTVEPGKLADLAIIDGDPLARISDLAKVDAVVANGRYLTRAELLGR